MVSTKHFFPSTEGVVVLGLENLVSRNNHLALDPANKVVYSKTHSPSKVALISGGGSGHEPAWSGYVGDGMLAAAVCGEVFASPSTKQIMAAIEHVPSDAGLILCITNYTGDNLHFGLAREKAAGMGKKVGVLRMTDDVALGRKQTENIGRRGLAANMFVLKLGGTAAQNGWPIEKILQLGTSVNDNAVTVGSSLDHCHIPGREHAQSIPNDTVVLGMGIHNEPGLQEIKPFPQVQDLVSSMLKYCLDPNDSDRAFVPFREGDQTCLLINNFGGMSVFETEALTTVTRQVLQKEWNISPVRIAAQCFETSLNAPGWSLSLVNFSGIERETGVSVKELLALLDQDTTAPAWPKNGYKEFEIPKDRVEADRKKKGLEKIASKAGPKVDPGVVAGGLRAACKAAIDAEPDITKWDIIMGDGDCGEAVVGMCSGILRKVEEDDLCASGDLFHILDEVENAVEEIGGTLGAIIAIVLAAFTSSLRLAEVKEVNGKVLGEAAGKALENLMGYTGARQGGRTVMDTLIPFCETFKASGDLSTAVPAAEKGADTTRGMKAKYGRASYIGEKSEEPKDAPPDPGAMAAAIFLRGLLNGLGGK